MEFQRKLQRKQDRRRESALFQISKHAKGHGQSGVDDLDPGARPRAVDAGRYGPKRLREDEEGYMQRWNFHPSFSRLNQNDLNYPFVQSIFNFVKLILKFSITRKYKNPNQKK